MAQQKQFDDYDPRAWLQRSGLLFLKYGAFSASIECFSRLNSVEPGYSLAWYGLSTVLYSASAATRNIELLKQAVAVLKHCLAIDGENELANKFYAAIPQQTPLEFSDIEAIEPSATFALPAELEFTSATFAECLASIPSAGERMQLVMWLGTFDDDSSRELLATALSDTDAGVVRATLKRLPADSSAVVVKALTRIHESGASDSYEPYFSMAARRLNLAFAKSGLWEDNSG